MKVCFRSLWAVTLLLSVACAGAGESPAVQVPSSQVPKDAAVSEVEPHAQACAPGWTLFRKPKDACRRPEVGGECGSSQCTQEEICCPTEPPTCLLAGTVCDAAQPPRPGMLGARCAPNGATGFPDLEPASSCQDGLSCVMLQDRDGDGHVTAAIGHCQSPGFEGTSCRAGSCEGGYVCADTATGGKCRIPGRAGAPCDTEQPCGDGLACSEGRCRVVLRGCAALSWDACEAAEGCSVMERRIFGGIHSWSCSESRQNN